MIKTTIKIALKLFNVDIIRNDLLQELIHSRNELSDARAIAQRLEFILPSNWIEGLNNSRSQLLQDMFVLSQLNFKKNGFFVEFGATDGVAISNTYLLETRYGWKGILAEPGKRWRTALKANRNCFIEESCVWRTSGSTLSFNDTADPELSTIIDFNSTDHHAKAREGGKIYDVNSISLIDLLRKYNAPKEIDYLSVDTEGSEYEILRHFDFSQYRFNVITCEHNYTPARAKIFDLLTSHGYVRRFEDRSSWDDWYVRK